MAERTSIAPASEAAEGYHELEKLVMTALPEGPLFTTDVNPDDLWAAYLGGLPAARMQHYNCHCCRRFVQKYGGLVTLNEWGMPLSAMWHMEGPEFFQVSLQVMRDIVRKATITGVFLDKDTVLGTPRTDPWSHLSAINPQPYKGLLKSAHEVMAEKKEDFKMLNHGLSDYPLTMVEQAVRVLEADALDRSEKTLGVAQWLAQLHREIAQTPKRKRNIIWLAVAKAPPGFCHVRSTMISTLLDDIKSGMDFDTISKRWSAKMHPMRYQRPTAAPSLGTIKQAEEIVAKLGIEKSLQRRYATLDDVQVKLWVPKPLPAVKTGGVFDHLKPTQTAAKDIELPEKPITWEKFQRTVLPGVLQMEIMVPSQGSFCGLLTATDPEAPPIIQWDGLEGHPRNPVSWYYPYPHSYAAHWNLSPGWNAVTCVFPSPFQWHEPEKFKHQDAKIHFAIAGAVPKNVAGLCLFPEILKSDMHSVRSVIEAHSNAGRCTGAAEGNANGMTVDGNRKVQLRVRTAAGTERYLIDRLD
jgi:hypothetical protein